MENSESAIVLGITRSTAQMLLEDCDEFCLVTGIGLSCNTVDSPEC